MRIARMTLPFLLPAAVACQAASPSAPSTSPAAQVPPAPSRVLCLADPGEGAHLEDLRQAQGAVRSARTTLADGWVQLAEGWLAAAREQADPGAYLHAEGCLELALDSDPRHKKARNLQLLVLLNGHRFAEARALAEALLAEDADDPMAWGSLSDALFELGDVEGATAAVQRMVDLKPNLPSYARASFLAWVQGDVQTAKVYIREAYRAGAGQKLQEPRAWVLTEAAELFWHEGDLDGADAGYDLALAQRPDHAPALQGKGRVALARHDAAAAVGYLRQALAVDPAVRTAWLLEDAAILAHDDATAAEARALVRRTGRSRDPRTWALYLLSRGERVDTALALLEAEHASRPGLYTRVAYAQALVAAGRGAEAQGLVDDVIALGVPDPALLWRAGLVRRAAGRSVEGLALQARAAALNPHRVALGLEAPGEAAAPRAPRQAG